MNTVKNGDNLIYTYTVGDNVFTSEESKDDVWRKAMMWQYEQGIKTLEEIEFEYGLLLVEKKLPSLFLCLIIILFFLII